jgi:hypothetical protein
MAEMAASIRENSRQANPATGQGEHMHTCRAHPDISVLADYLEVPGLGFLPVNAFVTHAAQLVSGG